MRHEDAGLSLWIAADDTARERAMDCQRPQLARQPSTARSLRQRLGRGFIALGERLAGESRAVPRRRLAAG